MVGDGSTERGSAYLRCNRAVVVKLNDTKASAIDTEAGAYTRKRRGELQSLKKLKYRRTYPAQLDIPSDFAGKKTFGELVLAMMEEDVLPLALYRKVKLARGVEISFVYTNPEPDTNLQASDSMFALVHESQEGGPKH